MGLTTYLVGVLESGMHVLRGAPDGAVQPVRVGPADHVQDVGVEGQ